MTPKRKQRLALILLMIAGIGIAVAFALKAFDENVMFFYTPTAISNGEAPTGHDIRMGGLVAEGSVQRQEDGLTVRFDLTDEVKNITVQFTGILPDLFREGQGIIAHGKLNNEGIFMAHEVLAKHDENYMPPEIAESLQAAKAAAKATGKE